MFPLRCSLLRVSISKTSRTPFSTIATRFSSSAVTLTNIDFGIESPRAPDPGPASLAGRVPRAAPHGGLDRACRRPARELRLERGSIAPCPVRNEDGPSDFLAQVPLEAPGGDSEPCARLPRM